MYWIHRYTNYFMLILLLLLANIICQAQQMAQSIDTRLQGKVPYVVIGNYSSNTYICMQTAESYVVKKFNSSMGEWSSMATPSIPNRCSQLIFVKKDTTFIALYELRQGKNATFYTQLFDTSFRAIGTAKEWTRITVSKNFADIDIVQSENKKHIALLYATEHNDQTTAHYIIADNAFGNYTLHAIDLGDISSTTEMKLNVFNNGNAVFTIAGSNKDNLTESMQVYGIVNGVASATPIDLNFKNTAYNYSILQEDNLQNKLIICMPYAALSNSENNYIWKITYDVASNTITNSAAIKMGIFVNKKNDIDAYANYLPRKIIVKSNGDVILVSEFFDMQEQMISTDMSHLVGSNPFRVNRLVKQYTYGDIIFTNISAQDSIIWQHTVRKNQATENDEGFFSSYAMALIKNKIAITFNSLDRNNTVQQALMATNGETIYAILNDAKIETRNLVFKQAKQITSNEIIVPCNRQNIFSFVKIRF